MRPKRLLFNQDWIETIGDWKEIHLSKAVNGYVISNGEDQDTDPILQDSFVCTDVDRLDEYIAVWTGKSRKEEDEEATGD